MIFIEKLNLNQTFGDYIIWCIIYGRFIQVVQWYGPNSKELSKNGNNKTRLLMI